MIIFITTSDRTLTTWLSFSLDVINTLSTIAGAAPLYVMGAGLYSYAADGVTPILSPLPSVTLAGVNLLINTYPDSNGSPTLQAHIVRIAINFNHDHD